jgi:predicted  nucleic acid-binding Zn-ribbon protein
LVKVQNDIRNVKDYVEANKEDIKTLFEEIEKLKKDLAKKTNNDEFGLLRTRVDTLESLSASLRKFIGEIDKKLKNMKIGGGGADPDSVQML